MNQNAGRAKLVACPNRPDRLVPEYSSAPSSRETENDMSDLAVGTSRNSNNAVRFGYAPGLNTINPISTGTR